MGLVHEIIVHCRNVEGLQRSAENKRVVDEVLGETNLTKIENVLKNGSHPGEKEFEIHVLGAAQKAGKLWSLYTTEDDPRVKRGGKKEKEIAVDHKFIVGGCVFLKENVEKWQAKNPKEKETELGEICKDLILTADKAIMEGCRASVKANRNNPDVPDYTQWLLKQKGLKPQKGQKQQRNRNLSHIAQDPATIKKAAKEWNTNVHVAEGLLQAARDQLFQEAQDLWPSGFAQPDRENYTHINSLVPEQARPKLTLEEAKAFEDYCVIDYEDINIALRGEAFRKVKISSPFDDKTVEHVKNAFVEAITEHRTKQNKKIDKEGLEGSCATYAKEFLALQKAFEKAEPFPEPGVPVQRGLKFKDKGAAKTYVAMYEKAFAENKLVPLPGFQSTSTAGIPESGSADKSKGELYFVSTKILAKKGLDAMPYATSGSGQTERELLLNHGTLVKVVHEPSSNVKDGITVWKVDLEQVFLKTQMI